MDSEAVRTCQFCGKALVPRPGERPSRFQERRFCSLKCANSKKEPTTKRALHYRAQKFERKACEACGEVDQLQEHHCDVDPKNNAEGNIQTLCIFCHDFIHETAKRRGWAVAGRMPVLYSTASGSSE